MTARIKWLPAFLDSRDEAELSSALKSAVNDIVFIDGQRWPTERPRVVDSIQNATAGEVFIWSERLSPIPVVPRPDGTYQGPTSGVVIQLERSRLVEGELRSGRLAAGYDDTDANMAEFVALVFRVLRRLTSNEIAPISGARLPHRVGPDALRWALESPGHRLRDRSVVALYFRPIAAAPEK